MSFCYLSQYTKENCKEYCGCDNFDWEDDNMRKCAWCGCTNNLNYVVNGAWENEHMCKNCYQELLNDSEKDFGIHNPCYPLYVRKNEDDEK